MPDMRFGDRVSSWPVLRQLRGPDRQGHGASVESARTAALAPRTAVADKVVDSICPFCAVGCGQRVFVRNGQITQIEGNPDSPISRGHLCPKGSATKALVTGPLREHTIKYRPPFATEWQSLELDRAMDMIADRIIDARRNSWQELDDKGHPLRRCMGIATLGGATLDNEENYLIKKLFTALGAVQIENQARI
jgi:formate dehydrogenase major subunit